MSYFKVLNRFSCFGNGEYVLKISHFIGPNEKPFIIGDVEHAKIVLAVSICGHQHRSRRKFGIGGQYPTEIKKIRKNITFPP